MKKWLARVLAILVIATGGVAIAAAPAWAAWHECPTSKFCLWMDGSGSGSMYYWGTEFLNTCVYIGPPYHDAGTSFKNNYTARKVTVYEHINCQGQVIQYGTWQGWFGPGNQKDFSGSFWNDKASSFYVAPL